MKLHELLKKTNDILLASEIGYVGYMKSDGFPSVAPRSFCTAPNMIHSYLSTGSNGNLAKAIVENNKMSICVHSEGNNITMIGTAHIITDMKMKETMWLDWFIEHFPQGVQDPNYCLIEFKTQRLSLWVDGESVEVLMNDIMKVQSNCGLLCDTCEYQESHQCKGCIAIKGQPFWGTCPVSSCCQDKGYDHCGQCPDMPCDLLSGFSCGDDAECDKPKGSRLEILKMWK
ncbi:pyridoxamine 5'-phosphate oxidase family protein [Vallitalea pronyensis]|uniref:Pyridoxamine 5'-phosphate oxidase family protein n=1 Tax=Vallitalea pronyensis TaxID=1348613 RepID=A0A8J8MLZ7_9FIRM|nr:pyridoxamine 5'-phosphate oxidase family protein [Vallitalea pronyensis]QUI23971.1 pyridoxamine 5'-phosphate oxidase family protein [Vallitalea pronyensis]